MRLALELLCITKYQRQERYRPFGYALVVSEISALARMLAPKIFHHCIWIRILASRCLRKITGHEYFTRRAHRNRNRGQPSIIYRSAKRSEKYAPLDYSLVYLGTYHPGLVQFLVWLGTEIRDVRRVRIGRVLLGGNYMIRGKRKPFGRLLLIVPMEVSTWKRDFQICMRFGTNPPYANDSSIIPFLPQNLAMAQEEDLGVNSVDVPTVAIL